MAQIAAVRHPKRVSGLVLVNTICYDSWPIPQVKLMRAAGSMIERLPFTIFRSIFSQFIRMGHDRPSRARESFHEHWLHYSATDAAAAFVRQVRSLNVEDTFAISGVLPHLNLPARLVWGAADNFQKIGYGYRLAHDLGAPLSRIEDGKHFVPEDHPEEVAQVVVSILSQLT